MKNRYYFIKSLLPAIRQIFALFILFVKKSVSLIVELKDSFMEKLRFSLTFKITIVYFSIMNRILIFITILITVGFALYLGWNSQKNMQRDYIFISNYLNENMDTPIDKIDDLSRSDNISVAIFDENGNVLYTNGDELSGAVFYSEDVRKDVMHLNNNYMLIWDKAAVNVNWSQPYDINNNFGYAMLRTGQGNWRSKIVYIQIKDRLVIETMSTAALGGGLLVLNIIFSIMMLIIGSRASIKALKPIETMTKTVENITINELGIRLDIRGSQDELKDLAKTFNNMLDRIQRSYEQQNQFVSDASHELRTPISVIQGYINLLDRWGKDDKNILEESISAIKSESENMKSLIEKLLFLARSDKNTQKIEKEEFYINELIDEIIKESRLIDDTHEIKSERNDTVTITADRKLLKEALRVFTDNSIKYTPQGGEIKINSGLQNSKLLISIEDNGIGISKEDLPHIFDRFYRVDKSRTKETGGTGLGLAIAKWIIQKHNGQISVQSTVNKGTKIEIVLPVSVTF
ncbi:signal transduction histidine-protein kinase ArlS [Oxobacter pfennigii]|uniref:histidine kinase n=1 Tax=Oxobacter pfennigii TaxID=36849 RepID=A0A0N8NTG5_9CLOT|nr:HAMP domain-containing sensor histidine kinase [Oxobacter pfennigii]KPU44768.1 signal transduction histidine-protein kinase ArlS [Oxobacter pfennigii]